jgi:hypothetical protein
MSFLLWRKSRTRPLSAQANHTFLTGFSFASPQTIAMLHTEPVFSALSVSYLLSRNIRIKEGLIDQLFNSRTEILNHHSTI